MKNVLVFLEANTTGSGMSALHKADLIGFHPVFLTQNPQRYIGLDQTKAEVIICDTNDLNAIQNVLLKHIGLSQVCGITTTSDFYVELVAALSECPAVLEQAYFVGNPSHVLHTCRNKALTRACLAAASIQQPHFYVARSEAEVGSGLAQLGLPCIIKPVDDSGSNNVKLCNREEEVYELTRHILSIPRNVRGQPNQQAVLLEEYIEYREYSVEMFSIHGEATCIGITEKHLTGFPFFVEARHIFPAPLPVAAQEKIILTVQQALHAVGFQNGPTHTEIKWSMQQGCVILEINPRLAGGMIPTLIMHAANIDLLEQQIRLAANQSVSLEVERRQVAGIQFLVADRNGVLTEIEGIHEAHGLPGIKEVRTTGRPGQQVRPPQNAYDRLGSVIAATETYEEIVRTLNQATRLITLRVH